MSLTTLLDRLEPGARVFLPGSAGEPAGLVEALCAPGAPALDILSSCVPGINPVPLDLLPDGSRFTGLFAHPQTPEARARGVFRQLPLSYGGFVKHLGACPPFDATIVHVAPPDAAGRCSLGPSVEFTELAARRSRRVLAVINPRIPALPGSVSLPFSTFEAWVEQDAPLRGYDVGAPSEQAAAIAARIAPFVPDGATLQAGLGKVPDALMRLIEDRRGLRLFSGLLSDGARLLAERGCLADGALHTACVALGSPDFYRWLADRPDFAVAGCDTTHAAARLAALPRFVAVNSAVSVDLLGQANLEMLDGRMISGVGGAADFARGAAIAPDGISIVALPSVAGREAVSRIVPQLDGVASLPRHDIDVIVTEHGAADLRGLAVAARAGQILQVAAPQHREALAAALAGMLARL